MSMTESEALVWFRGFYNGDCEREDFEDTICANCMFPCRHGEPILRAIAALEEVQQLHEIGTVSEFRELKEKATAKKPNPYVPDCSSSRFLEFTCPNCKEKVSDILSPTYCNCGQKLLWNRSERLQIHDD